MLNYTETKPEIRYHETYSFEAQVCSRRRSSLYRQVLRRTGGLDNGVLLEIAPGEKGGKSVVASVNICNSTEQDLLPRLLPLIQVESSFGTDTDISPLPWENQSFDTIICVDAFSLFKSHEQVLAEIRRVMDLNGRLILADQWFRHNNPLTVNLISRYPKENGTRIYSSSRIAKLLGNAGFGEIEFEVTGSNNYICTAIAV